MSKILFQDSNIELLGRKSYVMRNYNWKIILMKNIKMIYIMQLIYCIAGIYFVRRSIGLQGNSLINAQ